MTVIKTNTFLGGIVKNNKIVPSVSANDLILSLKTLAGTDPSASDPVYVKIGDAVRAVTAALSVTKADATNWANLGSAEFATNETDLFPYLVWNTNLTPDAVDIFWSRIPYGRLYSDFSGTTTNEKYAAINATAPAATDECINIGRFCATLSAGAGYTWTVPTFTNANLIQEPTPETRWLDWVPTPTGFSVNPTTLVSRYRVIQNTITLFYRSTGNGTSNATTFTLSLPFTAKTITNMSWGSIGLVVDNGITQTTPGGLRVLSAATVMDVFKDVSNAAFMNSGGKRLASTNPMTYEIG